MMKKNLFYTVLLILVIIFVGCSKNINQDNESGANINQQNNIENINIHKVPNYELEFCQNIGAKEKRDELSCECVKYPQFGNIWVCNNKVIVGDSYMSLNTFRKNKCSILLMEMPGCGLVDGKIKCGGFNCQKDTLVFSEVNQTYKHVEQYIKITSVSSESVTFDSIFGTTACPYDYSYQRDDNHLKIIKTLNYDLCEDMTEYSGLSASIINLPEGKYKISIYYKYDKKYTDLEELLSDNFEIK